MELGEIPEDMIKEILLRLDIKALFRNKCISKQWNSMISDPNFRSSYRNKSQRWLRGHLPRSIRSRRDVIDKHSPSLYLPNHLVDVIASSNGLVLCSGNYTPTTNDDTNRLYVCNPLTKKYIGLRLMPIHPWGRRKICFSTRPDNNSAAYVSYRVVAIRIRENLKEELLPGCAIRIYSSDTQRWSDDEREVKTCPIHPCSKGILHWFDFTARIMVTYDPYDSPHEFGCIDLPKLNNLDFGLRVILLQQQQQQDEVRTFGEIEDDRRLIVWRRRAQGEWVIQQTCLISPSWDLPQLDHYRPMGDYFCCLGVDDDQVCPLSWESCVPFTFLCPWASPSPSPCDGKDTTRVYKARLLPTSSLNWPKYEKIIGDN